MTQKVVMLSRGEPDTELIETQMQGIDYELEVHSIESEGEAMEAVKGADVIIDQGIVLTREIIEEIDQGQAIISFGHGFNHIDHEAATDQSVMVVNSAGFCTEEVSNHAITMLLACAKKLTILNDLVKAGKWGAETRDAIVPMVPIDGNVLGLVAFGNIARAAARKAKAFGIEVIAYDPYVAPWIAKEYGVRLVGSLEELAASSDFISVHTPLNNQTKGLIGADFFKAMKSTAYFINTCRGPVVDEAALIEALRNKEFAGAGLDVCEEEPTAPDNPLVDFDNVIGTPHSAGSSSRSTVAAGVQVGHETARILRGTLPMSLVHPEVRHKIAERPMGLNPSTQ